MKYDQFDELCRSEWAKEDRGEVVALNLTGPSMAELANDVLGSGDVPCTIGDIRPGDQLAVAAGAGLSHARHPVTGSVITVNGPADADVITVKHGPDGSLTRTLALA